MNIYRKLYTRQWATKPTLTEGEFVRIRLTRETFFKGYSGSFSDRVFKVKEILKSYPITYKLVNEEGDDVLGVFYKEELSSVIN
jgi:uncharacterized pyridoxamine 5'-phosphate oxidase family protein